MRDASLPRPSASAWVLCVGDELLSGDVVNTNAAFLGQRLRRLGVVLGGVLVVPDRPDEIATATASAAQRSAAVLITGGLGPTSDDLTTLGVAQAAGVPLRRDPEAEQRLEEKFRRLGRPMPEANRKQAELPRGAQWLANPIGTAEGFTLRLGDAQVFVTPGVPTELRMMMLEQVEPLLRQRLEVAPVLRRMYRILGQGESAVAERVEPIVAAARAAAPSLGLQLHYRATNPEVLVVVEAPDPGPADDTLRSLDTAFAEVLGPALYGIGEADLPTRVVTALQQCGQRLALAESCTGGLAASLLTAVPGASQCFVGALVAYQNSVKTDLLGVPPKVLREHGAVSEPCARAMAEGARRCLGSDLAVSITGIAGPEGGSPAKPVGTVHIALADSEGTVHRALHLRGDRTVVQRASALWAHKLLWDRLLARGLIAPALWDLSPSD